MILWLVRNGDCREDRWPCPKDSLSAIGFAQSRALADSLHGLISLTSPTVPGASVAIVSSDHIRAVQTIQPFAEIEGHPIQIHEGLRSIDLGDFCGRTVQDIQDALGIASFQEMLSDPVPDKRHFPNGETLSQQAARVSATVDEIVAKRERQNPLVVSTHASCIQIVLCMICDMPLSRLWTWRIPEASITEIEYGAGRWSVSRVGVSPL